MFTISVFSDEVTKRKYGSPDYCNAALELLLTFSSFEADTNLMSQQILPVSYSTS